MKFAVGVMLSSFRDVLGRRGPPAARWPGGDAALLVIIPAVLAHVDRDGTRSTAGLCPRRAARATKRPRTTASSGAVAGREAIGA